MRTPPGTELVSSRLVHTTVYYFILCLLTPNPVSVLCDHDISYLIVILKHLCDDADLWVVVFNRYHSVGG